MFFINMIRFINANFKRSLKISNWHNLCPKTLEWRKFHIELVLPVTKILSLLWLKLTEGELQEKVKLLMDLDPLEKLNYWWIFIDGIRSVENFGMSEGFFKYIFFWRAIINLLSVKKFSISDGIYRRIICR